MTNKQIIEEMKKQDEVVKRRREELAKLMDSNPVEEMIKINKRFNEELKTKNCKTLNYKDCKKKLQGKNGGDNGKK